MGTTGNDADPNAFATGAASTWVQFPPSPHATLEGVWSALGEAYSYLVPSGNYEVSHRGLTGLKRKLILSSKKLGRVIVLVITVAFVIALLTVAPNVTGQQEPIYIPDEQTTTATSTQREEAPEEVPAPTIEEREPLPIIYNDEDYVVQRILETFPEAPIMVVVARCESGLDPTADRESRGVDVGLFQINQVHLPTLNRMGLDRWDLEDNLTYARMLYDNAGLRDWYMSEHCWSPYL